MKQQIKGRNHNPASASPAVRDDDSLFVAVGDDDSLFDLMQPVPDSNDNFAAPAASTVPAGPVGIDAATSSHMPGWYKGLIVTAQGLLFQNQIVAVMRPNNTHAPERGGASYFLVTLHQYEHLPQT